MVGHGGSTSPIPSHCASIVATSTLRVKTSQCSEKLAIQEFGRVNAKPSQYGDCLLFELSHCNNNMEVFTHSD